MPLPSTDLRDCTEKCRSKQHGKLINAALTKRSVSDSDLCSYLDTICCCCDTVKDYEGQTALHMSVSCGRTNVVKWLAKYRRANINLKDCESGFTPLHKSIFYGKIDIAVQLIKLGANLLSTDFDGYTVLENAMLDLTEWKELANELMPTYSKNFDAPLFEIYAWGSNANYTFGPQQERALPERLDIFHKHNPGANVRKICLEKFHCVILTTSGEVFASGHGYGGRLGFENEQTVLVPERIKFHVQETVINKVSISVDHSIFLSNSGHVWTCGQNSHCVLGINPPPPCVLKPHQLPATQHSLENILAAKYHSIAWGHKALYTWGLNGGQLGHHVSTGKYIITPKVVPHILNLTCVILDVASSNAAIAVLMSNFEIYVLHQYNCSKITANHLSIRTFGITGGKISTKIDHNESIEENHELVIVINNTLDHLYVWSELTPTFTRCIFTGNRCFKISQLTLNLNEILFITNFGEAYKASFKSKIKINIENENALLVRKNNANKILHNNTYQVLKVTKIPHVHRAISIHSDIEGRNFACLQINPAIVLNNSTRTHTVTLADQLYQLLISSAEDDCVHDIVFKVSYRLFPVHHYIISSKCAYLHGLIKTNNSKVIELFNIEPLIFEQILFYIYTDTCELMHSGPLPTKFQVLTENLNDNVLKSPNESTSNVKPVKDPIRMLQEVSKTFELHELHKFLKKTYICDNCIAIKHDSPSTGSFVFSRYSFPELCNVTLRTIDNNTIKVHKCILVAKMEYFNNLFSVRWKENSTRTEISFPHPFHIVDGLIDYLYTDELPNLNKKDLDYLSNLLVLADEFFLQHMKDLCEDALISHITLKTVATIFSFSYIYNANHLKLCCMRFICYNLPAILESKCLEAVDDELLQELTNYYNDFNTKLQQRIITPYMDAPSDEIISEIAKNNPIKFDGGSENCIKTIAKHKRKRLLTRKSGSSESNKTELNSSKNDETLPEISNLSLSEIEASQNPKEEPFSKVQIRVKALVAAREIVGLEDDQSNFEKLKPKSEFSLSNFPELMDHSPTTKSVHKSEKVDFKQKIPKLSQKQRKRLSSESNFSGPELSTSPVTETPKNPWKIMVPIVSNKDDVFGNTEPSLTMESIITAEIKQKENFIKMKTKLLAYTQIEDKAIDDLKKFYNVEMVSDEVITVNRVQTGLVASPVWVPIKK